MMASFLGLTVPVPEMDDSFLMTTGDVKLTSFDMAIVAKTSRVKNTNTVLIPRAASSNPCATNGGNIVSLYLAVLVSSYVLRSQITMI